MIALAFLSGIAFSVFVVWLWSLCRSASDADQLMERIDEKGGNDARQLL